MKYRTYFSDLTAKKIDSYAAMPGKERAGCFKCTLSKAFRQYAYTGLVGNDAGRLPLQNFSESEQDGYNCPLNRSESDRLFSK